MQHFSIKERGSKDIIGICYEEQIEDVEAELVLGPGDWLVQEIDDDEADKFAKEWANGPLCEEDICPICAGPRSRTIRGTIILRRCRSCGLES